MNIYDFTVRTADNRTTQLRDYAGQLLLIVNVASQCGFTPQYEGLEALYREFSGRGLQVLGFPCNQFGEQEPGTDAEIQQFCRANYDVTFPVFGKLEVDGPDADPLYGYLRAQAPGEFGPADSIGTDEIKWNFTKFLVGPDGEVIRRYEPTDTPEQIRADIDAIVSS